MPVDRTSRLQQIRQRTAQKRKRALFVPGVLSFLLLLSIRVLLHGVHTPGIAVVPGASGSLLLRSGAADYIVVGIIAFTAGVFLTAGCIRLSCKPTTPPEQKAHRQNSSSHS